MLRRTRALFRGNENCIRIEFFAKRHRHIIIAYSVLKNKKQKPPITRSPLPHLDLPQGFTRCRSGGRGPPRRPEENAMLLLVFVHGEELLLFRVEKAYHVSPFEDTVLILPVVHEERDLPARHRVQDIHLKRNKALFSMRIIVSCRGSTLRFVLKH